MLELLSDWVDNLSLCVGGRARAPSSGRSDKRYLEGQIFLRLDSSPLPAIRPDSPVCDTSDSECDSVSLGPSQPSYQCVLPASACTPSLRMKHSFFFYKIFLCVCTRLERMCERNAFVAFLSLVLTRAPKTLPSPSPGVGERRRAASPPTVAPLVRQTAHNRGCLSIRGHNRALLIHFTAVSCSEKQTRIQSMKPS